MRTAFESKLLLCAFFLFSIAVVALAQSAQEQPSAVAVGTNYLSQARPDVYQYWLDEDVRWIISSDERKAFEKLTDNTDRDQFVEEFWLRRDPTPGTTENEYRKKTTDALHIQTSISRLK
jgi:hypothetical protein